MSTFSHRAAALVACLVACLSLAAARPAHAQLFGQGTLQNTGLSPSGVVSGDVNGGGKAEVLMVAFVVPGGMALQVFLADATGFTLTTSTVHVPSFEIGGVTVADVDADGKADLVVAERHTLYVFWGNGAGQFPTSTLLPGFFDARTVAVGDLNGDGVPDPPGTDPNSGLPPRVGPGRGAPTFGAPIGGAVGETPALVAVGIADVDGDRHPDLLAGGLTPPGNVFVVGRNQGNFGFAAIPP